MGTPQPAAFTSYTPRAYQPYNIGQNEEGSQSPPPPDYESVTREKERELPGGGLNVQDKWERFSMVSFLSFYEYHRPDSAKFW